MASENFVVSYSLCKNCNKDLSKAGNAFCRECKPKTESNRTLNKKLSKVYISKFETKSSSYIKPPVEQKSNLEPKFSCLKFRLKKELALPAYKKSPGWLADLFWDHKIDEVPVALPPMQIMLPIPHSRPKYLLTQEYYLDELLESYFNHLHPIVPLFSIHSFDPRTASKYLLSAMYFGGFLFMRHRPIELMSYFSECAKGNIKELVRVISFRNMQAMTLYSFIVILTGDFALSRACQAHAIRMSYSLGLHLNFKKLSPIQQYDRLKIFSTICTIHIGLSGASHLALNYITEIGESNSEITKPEYQIPNQNCAFYFDTEDENIEYGICADTFTRFHDDVSISHWKLSQCRDHCIQDEFERGLIEINQRKEPNELTESSDLIFKSSVFGIQKETSLSPIKISQKQFTAFNWAQFKDFDIFSSFILKSGKVSVSYFTLNSFEIQKKPNIEYFIHSKIDKLPVTLPPIQIILPIPISRPLQLLTQKSYWNELIKSYFQHLHPILPFFSIHSFNPLTADKSLLSAVCYGGFQFMQYKPPELITYFDDYAIINITETAKKVSFQRAQATNLYSYIMLLKGNFTLSKFCQAYTIRMIYTLGIHLNVKNLTPIKKYDRLLLFSSIFTIHMSFSLICHTDFNHLTEIIDCNIEPLEPEYQIPNSNCIFHFDTQDENIVYGIIADTFYKSYYSQTQSLWLISKCSEHSILDQFDRIVYEVNIKYAKCLQTFNTLSRNFPKLKSKILSQKFKLILFHHMNNLEMFRILKSKIKELSPSQISCMIGECCSLFDSVVESQEFDQVSHIHPYSAAINFIRLYPISSSIQQAFIKQKLKEILDFLSNRVCTDKLSFLVIKNGYELIIKP
ncbi:hypothetical protein CONCODRAFT_11518 [Conidiobolus coronatus NRRL 28638]|uniref:Xylanolytic transcriptional activator regulatory domain-containing protein n=1 Tax=Conidiobolus coronatus (strain ATCC 28846 / CBS 209.66 / NRRL 28638) TaxID=796925 RepID=A0A137NVE6_CONC2|nr:hypothetical protein CONCODRAFT_11518 [Conidiobolus coronatus NRRL 28638]|eukprot:KXN66594.1 hypothetical protein CONCODRAFT_11518 [Conidiobolus coronatus NRRL 28638]